MRRALTENGISHRTAERTDIQWIIELTMRCEFCVAAVDEYVQLVTTVGYYRL